MADKIFFNGKIHTMARDTADGDTMNGNTADRDAMNGNAADGDAVNRNTVTAIAVKGHLIEAVGDDEAIRKLADSGCEMVDLSGRCVVPGFNDSHCHVLLTGLLYERLYLGGVTSVQEMIERGRAFIKAHQIPAGTWIIGTGYDHNQFDVPVLPDGAVLEAVSTVHPVMIERVCGHVGAANRLALSLAGFDENTIIQGGVLDKDASGHLTGIMREAALDQFKMRMPKPDAGTVKRAILRVCEAANRDGITSMQTDDLEGAPLQVVLQAYRELEEEGRLSVRIWEEIQAARLPVLQEFLKCGLRTGDGSRFFKTGNIKLLADGSLGARTAYFRQPYEDDPGNCGVAVYTQEELTEVVMAAHAAGMQVAVHAIGDGAVAQCVTAFEKAFEADGRDLRNRIVHCQFADRALLERMKKSHIAVDIQPPFVPSDYPLVKPRLGSREKEGYAWKTMLDMGIHAGGGSDSPVETFNPLWGIYCAVSRMDGCNQPEGGWRQEEKLTVEEAVRLYTAGGAYLSFEENIKGTLEPGKLADFAVLDQDIFSTDTENIKDTRVVMTVMDGKIYDYGCFH